MSDVHDFKYCTMYLKKHKKSNKLILFVCFKDNVIIDDVNIITIIIKDYNNFIKKNNNLSIIVDARGIMRCTKNVAFWTSDFMLQFKQIYKSNIDKVAIILELPVMKLLLNSVTTIHPFVVPTNVVNNNKSAIAFVINKTD